MTTPTHPKPPADVPVAESPLRPVEASIKPSLDRSPETRERLERYAGIGGTVVPGLFFVVMIVLGQVTPHYDALSRFGSELSLGRYGWIMIANFVILGISILGLGGVLWRRLGTERAGRLGARMVGFAGVAFLIAGVFVTDLHGTVKTWHGALHFTAAVIIFFIAVPIGAFMLSRRLRCVRWLSRYCAFTAIATPVLFIATVVAGPYLGLMERIVIGVILAWFSVLAGALRTGRIGAASV